MSREVQCPHCQYVGVATTLQLAVKRKPCVECRAEFEITSSLIVRAELGRALVSTASLPPSTPPPSRCVARTGEHPRTSLVVRTTGTLEGDTLIDSTVVSVPAGIAGF